MRRCLIAWNAFAKLKNSSYLMKSSDISCQYFRPNVNRAFSSTCSDAHVEKMEGAVQDVDLMIDFALENSSSLTTAHLLTTLNSFTENFKNDPNSKTLEEAKLKLVCSHLLKKIRFFELQEVVNIIYSLVFLKVPADTIVMQCFLQVIRSRVNELNFGQIFWLTTIFRKASPTPLVKALKLALPIVLSNHLDIEMDRSDPKMLAKLFSYAAHHHFSKDDLKKISLPLMKLSEQLTYDDAITVLWGAVFLRFPLTDFGDLIFTATNIVVQHASQIPRDSLIHLLPRLEKVSLLSEPLLNAVGKKALLEKWELKPIHELLLLMNRLSYLDTDLLETYAEYLEKYFVNQDAIPSLNLQTVVALFARQNFLSHNMEFLLQEFIKQKEQINSIQAKPVNLVKFALDLIILGADKSDVSKLLHGSQECLYTYSKMADCQFLKNIVMLKNILGTSFTNEKLDKLASEVHEQLYDKAVDIVRVKKFPLKLTLAKGLQHQPYQIYNGLITKYGTYFDHLIVNSGSTNIKESCSSEILHVADELFAKETPVKIAILVNSNENYAVNTNHHNGETQLTILTLEKEGYATVQICLRQWEELLNHEREPYLMRAIEDVIKSRDLTN